MQYEEYKEYDRFGRDISEGAGEEFEELADAFLEYIKESAGEAETTFLLNPHRVEQMEFSYKMLLKSVRDVGKDVKVTYSMSDVNRTMAWMRVEGKRINALDIERFSRACEFADATDIYPLTNGNVRIELTFRGIFAAS